MWIWIGVVTVITTYSAVDTFTSPVLYDVSPLDARIVSDRAGYTAFCSFVELASNSAGDDDDGKSAKPYATGFYLMDEKPRTYCCQSQTRSEMMTFNSPNSYEYWGFYLLEGTLD